MAKTSARDGGQASGAEWQPAPPLWKVEQKSEPYGGDRYPTPLRSGQWESMLVGPFIPYAEDQDITRRYYGVPHRETFLNFKAWTDDGSICLVNDKMTSPTVGGEGGALVASAWYPTARIDAGVGKRTPDPRRAAFTGKAQHELTADGRNRYAAETTDGTDEILFDDKTVQLRAANGGIDLRGVRPTPAFQCLLPWRTPSGEADFMYYTTQPYLIEGTYFGQAVTGYSMVEHAWGNRTWLEHWWYRNRSGHFNNHSLTTYSDGTTELCLIFYGTYGARGALIVDSDNHVVVNTGEVNVERQAGGRYVYSFVDGPDWEFVPDHPDTNFPGTVKRVGETREVVRAYAYCSVFSSDLRPPSQLGQTTRPMA
jgi:hypothetical protein